MRRAMWLVPCWVACTSATPPPEAKEAEPAPEAVAAPEPVPVCKPGSTRPCYPGPAGTEGVGTCTAGVEACKGTGWSECADAVAPAADEHCGTPRDEDCDGRSDDCPEVEVALAIAFTRDRPLELAGWGGGLGIVGGPLFWVVEPGGRVVDVWEEPESEPGWERNPDSSEAQSTDIGGAWPAALVRNYETGGTRAGYIMEQERWDGSTFADVENSDELLQWRYEGAVPWQGGHAIAVRRTYQSYETMEQLDPSTLEHGAVTREEQRALERKVDRLLGKAEPRIEVFGGGEIGAWEPSHELFAADGGDAEGEVADDPTPDDMAAAVEELEKQKAEEVKAKGKARAPRTPEEPAGGSPDGADAEAVGADAGAAEGAPELPQPPELPGELQSFVVLSDGTIAMVGGASRMWTWKLGQRGWKTVEPPQGFDLAARDVSLHAGLETELLLRDCDKLQKAGTLRRLVESHWDDMPLPTTACPRSLAMAADGMRWVLLDEQLWQRRSGEGEPWKRVPLPAPWKPRQVVAFDGQVWIAAEGEGGKWAVLVDRPVSTPRSLPVQ